MSGKLRPTDISVLTSAENLPLMYDIDPCAGGSNDYRSHGRQQPAAGRDGGTEPAAGDGSVAAPAVHRRRHPRYRHLRAHRPGRQAGRRRRMAAVRRGLRRGGDHRLQLSGAGDEISARRRRGALHAQGVRHPLRDVHRRVRRDVLGHHLGVDGLAGVRRQPVELHSASTSPAGSELRCSGWLSWPWSRRSTSAASARA